MLLRLYDDTLHRLNCIHRVFTIGGFTTQHHRVSIHQDSTRDIRYLCTGRARIVDHAVEHLCGNDYWLLLQDTAVYNIILDGWNLLKVYFNAKVASSDQNTIAGINDLINIIYSLLIFNLRDNLDRLATIFI